MCINHQVWAKRDGLYKLRKFDTETHLITFDIFDDSADLF